MKKKAMGIDTSSAEEKYLSASQKYETAVALPSTPNLAAQNNFTSAQNDIDNGERLLDRAWAEKMVMDAQMKVDELDALIGWFKGNQSTANDAYLPSIVTRREIAASYIMTANDEIVYGNYEEARRKAQEAYNRANESDITGDTFERIQPAGPLPLYSIAGVGAIILLVVGIILWKKFPEK